MSFYTAERPRYVTATENDVPKQDSPHAYEIRWKAFLRYEF